MTDLMNLVMLLSASVGSMAFGILVAYGVLRAGFMLMRSSQHPLPVKPQREAARVL